MRRSFFGPRNSAGCLAGKGEKAERIEFSDEEAESVTGGDAFDGEGVDESEPAMKNPVPLAERTIES